MQNKKQTSIKLLHGQENLQKHFITTLRGVWSETDGFQQDWKQFQMKFLGSDVTKSDFQ